MDAYFVHDPGDVLRVMQGSPMHVSLESDLCSSQNRRQDWWECPNRRFAELMWAKGVQSQAIFNVNGGFIVVHRDVIGTLSSLTYDFWKWCQTQGYLFNDEPLLAYAMHRLCGDLHLHTLRETADVWASDWTGRFRDKLPDGRPWWSTDYFTGKRTRINPAIVHAMRSKDALVQAGLSLPHRNRVSRNH
jgi:hypothetical protein